MLEFSILVKTLHKIFGHNTDYVVFLVFCFAACLPATVEVYSQSSLIAIHFKKAQMSHVLSIVKWNGAYYTKNVIIMFKKS